MAQAVVAVVVVGTTITTATDDPPANLMVSDDAFGDKVVALHLQDGAAPRNRPQDRWMYFVNDDAALSQEATVPRPQSAGIFVAWLNCRVETEPARLASPLLS